jgi:hypothetical protein
MISVNDCDTSFQVCCASITNLIEVKKHFISYPSSLPTSYSFCVFHFQDYQKDGKFTVQYPVCVVSDMLPL